jgi:hypothetical protein
VETLVSTFIAARPSKLTMWMRSLAYSTAKERDRSGDPRTDGIFPADRHWRKTSAACITAEVTFSGTGCLWLGLIAMVMGMRCTAGATDVTPGWAG